MSIFKKYRWLSILSSVFLIALGIVIIVLSIVNSGVIDLTITISTSAILFMVGAVILVTSFLNDSHKTFTTSLLYGSFAVALGIVILILQTTNVQIVQQLLVYVFSIFLISYGASNIIKGITFIIFHAKASLVALLFILGTLLIAAGILALVFFQIAIIVTYIALGSVLIVLGIFSIIKIAAL